MEAADAGIATIFCITERIPALDMLRAVPVVQAAGARLIGPNCPGATTPGQAKVGIIPGSIHRPGRVGLVSRSGTLTYEVVQAMTDAGIGQSTCVGIGGDPIIGSTFVDILSLFRDDPETEAVVLIGEIGGDAEERAAAFVAEQLGAKPVVSFIAGRTAPEGKRTASGWPTHRPTSLGCWSKPASGPADRGAAGSAAESPPGGSARRLDELDED